MDKSICTSIEEGSSDQTDQAEATGVDAVPCLLKGNMSNCRSPNTRLSQQPQMNDTSAGAGKTHQGSML